MKTKSITTSQRLKITYVEENSNKEQTIVFIHGNSGSSMIWRELMRRLELKDYTLIAVDLPGHGESARSSDPHLHYSPKETAKILAEFVSTALKGKRYLLSGFCYGTNLIAEMLPLGIEPAGLVFITPNILGGDITPGHVFKPNESAGILFREHVEADAIDPFFKDMLSDKYASNLYLGGDLLRTDGAVRAVLARAVQEKNYSNEIALVRNSGVPVLCIFGSDDPLVNPQYMDNINAHWRIVKVEGARHYVHLEAPDKIAGLIIRFTKEAMGN